MTDLSKLRYFAVFRDYADREAIRAAFEHEGDAAAWLSGLPSRYRRNFHLEDRDGNVIENVRYREDYGGSYGHAMAIAEKVAERERERLAEQGFRFADTGKLGSAR